jgi:CubicO group peptidase (beta-lactamase class C family)
MITLMTNAPAGLHDINGLGDFLATLASDDEPGLAVGVYTGGELAAFATAGCAVPEHGVRVTQDTAFDIASVSKHTTSACMLLLARDGLVDLGADVCDVLPELALAQPVTLRQCLTHTAGLRDYFGLCDIAGISTLGMGEDKFLDLVAGQAELDFPAGSAFSYSNTGYALAAVIVRRVTGAGLAKFAAERVFEPLGMSVTHFRDNVGKLVPHLANGYLIEPGNTGFRRCDVTEEIVGDGAVVTTIADLAGWHAFMASGAVLGPEIRDALLVPQVLTDGTTTGYALGLDRVDVAGTLAWWHSGSWAGYRSAVIYLPDQRAGISVLANRNDRYASHVALATATALLSGADPRSCYDRLSGIEAPHEQAKAQAAEIAGLWHEPDHDLFIQFDAVDGQLAVHEQGGDHRFVLGTDGRWHGRGMLAGGTCAVAGQMLTPGWGLSARPEARYQRAPGQGQPTPALPVGIFRNEELRASAELSLDESGAAKIVIGLAAPRVLQAAGISAWRSIGNGASGPLTVRVAEDGSGLLVSAPGARRVRFEHSADAARPALPRGLSAAG